MSHSAFAASSGSAPTPFPIDGYQPGVCNIGPAEIARRRRAGNVGVLASVVVFAALVVLDVPPIARIVVALPAMIAASGYLQAYLKFCAGFGSRGIFNFGEVGPTQRVADEASRAADRTRARQIGLASAAIGVVVGIVAVLLPV
jgi:hypothetical protein